MNCIEFLFYRRQHSATEGKLFHYNLLLKIHVISFFFPIDSSSTTEYLSLPDAKTTALWLILLKNFSI